MKKRISTILILCCLVAVVLIVLLVYVPFGDESSKKQYVIHHLNGGYTRSGTEDYNSIISSETIEEFEPCNVEKSTWVLENWYFDESLTEVYTKEHLKELQKSGNDIHLYAKWIDEITITEENFADYFMIKSSWNGGTSTYNAAIKYSITPLVVFDPQNSAESFEVDFYPILTYDGEVVWNGIVETITLTPDMDYSYSDAVKLDSSAVGIKFNIFGKKHKYSLKTPSFKMKLLHQTPVEITLDFGGDICENQVIVVDASKKLERSDLPTPQIDGYEFFGWYMDAEFKTEFKECIVTRPRTLYAKMDEIWY